MKYLHVFKDFLFESETSEPKEFVPANNNDVLDYSERNKYFDVIYSSAVRNKPPGGKMVLQLSKKEHPIAANGSQMAGEYIYDAFATMDTKNGKFTIYFGGKGSSPKGEPIPNFVEFKKVYTSPEEYQKDKANIDSISQNKKGLNFEVQQIENGWAVRLERLDRRQTDRDFKMAENLSDFLVKTFR